MKIILSIFFACIILDGIFGSPIKNSYTPSYNALESRNHHRINLDHFGNRIYGLPSREAGRRVHNWRKGDKVNPEELGPYAEGDILFGISLKNGWGGESHRWPNKIIPYVITGTSFSEADRAMIQSAMDEVHYHTCVRFVPRTNEPVYIRITSKSSGCYSGVGYTGQNYDVNLQAGGCTSYKGTVLHELTHAIGFVHEHSRAERDDYITVNMDNVEDDQKDNFIKYQRDQMNYYDVTYDYTSVMHYTRYAMSKNGRETIVTKPDPNVKLGQRYGYSKGDILKINRMYQCGESRKEKEISVHTEKPVPSTTAYVPKRPEFSNKRPRSQYRVYCNNYICWKQFIQPSYYHW